MKEVTPRRALGRRERKRELGENTTRRGLMKAGAAVVAVAAAAGAGVFAGPNILGDKGPKQPTISPEQLEAERQKNLLSQVASTIHFVTGFIRRCNAGCVSERVGSVTSEGQPMTVTRTEKQADGVVTAQIMAMADPEGAVDYGLVTKATLTVAGPEGKTVYTLSTEGKQPSMRKDVTRLDGSLAVPPPRVTTPEELAHAYRAIEDEVVGILNEATRDRSKSRR